MKIRAKNIFATKCISGRKLLSCFPFKAREENIKSVKKNTQKLVQKVIPVLNKNWVLYNIFEALKNEDIKSPVKFHRSLIIKEQSIEAKVIQREICPLLAEWILNRCLQVSIKLMLRGNRKTTRPQSIQRRLKLQQTNPLHSLLKAH